ncbi:MAG: forespore capture DNA-binding protein RefZ [Brevibacillus sp.]|nr:forespore capture DNA-binding protein RefZ [Brevibacillus sp.]
MKRGREPINRGTDQTKARILAAAAKLFDAQGFDGTTVRQIAKEADVNLALISYHFQGKRGLLEVLIASYYETFFRLLAAQKAANRGTEPLDELIALVRLYVFFQRDHAAVTRLIQRELSVESMLAREVMTVYIHRWKHSFASIIEDGITRGVFAPLSVDQVLLAMTSLLVYPYLNPQSVREVYYLEPGSDEFCEWLVASVEQLLRSLLKPSPTTSRR